MKKFFIIILAALMSFSLLGGCGNENDKENDNTPGQTTPDPDDGNPDNKDPEDPDKGDPGDGKEEENPNEEENPPEAGPSTELKTNLSADGYVKGKISDFSVYEGTEAYRKVKTADELIEALVAAKYHYTNVWDDETGTYTQKPADGYNESNFEGTVHVIEIENDLNLGYNVLSATAKGSGIVDDFCKGNVDKWKPYLSMSDMLLENGISQIKVENTSNLLIYSKNGAKLTHCGFKLTSDTNVVFRNLEFDELWQWEDAPVKDTSKIGDYDWFGWAYFKIAFCGYIWIDHCTFGKSYDGQIDYSNPVYNANAGTAFRAPYGADGNNGLHISWCNFNAGSDDPDGYLYKMMAKIEADYQAGGTNYLYYNALRESGATFEDILYGIAIPQKKGFLCGDDAKETDADYTYNLKLQVSFANCKFTNLEDRIPKLRGGNAYMYNCVVDSLQYYGYRTTLKGLNAANVVTKVNSGWKCGLVSQGIVCGSGGSVKAENCIFKGIEYLLKNNDSKASGTYVYGGYQLVNCTYQKGANDAAYTGSSSDSGNKFTNDTTSKLKPDLFSWHTEGNVQPFQICAIALEDLAEYLNNSDYGTGVNAKFTEYLKSNYLE